ncbi:MAG: hypothetical protein LBL39_02975 [Planctomycetaceae bacterium]|nr:hypothetical protein [Planctomycetaceae bacterium]
MDNPVQTKCSTGSHFLTTTNCVAVQPKTLTLTERVELLRSSVWWDSLPRAAFHLHGVIHVKVLRTWNRTPITLFFTLSNS